MRQKRYRVKFAGCVKTTATIRNYFSFSTFEEKNSCGVKIGHVLKNPNMESYVNIACRRMVFDSVLLLDVFGVGINDYLPHISAISLIRPHLTNTRIFLYTQTAVTN